MTIQKYPHLFRPLKLGPVTLRHRVVMPGHSMHMGDFVLGVSPRYQEYLCRRARGGAALVGVESAPVQRSTLVNFNTVNLFSDEIIPTLRVTAERIHEAGSILSVILWHGGHNISHRQGYHAIAPSPIPSPTFRETPKVMTLKDIAEVVAAYGDAARRCNEAGVDVLEVQTATDYLLGSFLSPTMNRRQDAYGGSQANRCRIVREILETVREAAGDNQAVGVRTSAAHLIPNDPNDYGLEESIGAMALLESQGLIDYVSVITGSHYSFGATIPAMHWSRPQIIEEGIAFKEKLSLPVILAGRIRTPLEAEEIIASGAADAVGMARSWIAEPDWVLKIEKGEEESIRPCMSCNQGCLGNAIRNLPGTCVLNPEAGHEIDLLPLESTIRSKQVIVVGGGPAGLELARTSALRGHKVVLYEASGELGGQMRLAASAPYREEMQPAIDWWIGELNKLQVRVVLNHKVDPQNPPAADTIVWAVGSESAQTQVWRLRPYLENGIPGAEQLLHGREVMANNLEVRGKVLIIDEEGGWPAISLVETLQARKEVSQITLVTSDLEPGGPDLAVTFEDQAVKNRLRDAKIVLHSGVLVERVIGNSVRVNDGTNLGPFDSIVLSTGTLPALTPSDCLAAGDCVAPRGIWAAVNDATRLARTL